jgi:MerR family transcriptional regulator, redox-sensitive transcriptional activator SoxR
VAGSGVITIGELSARTGCPVSALRFHEAEGLVTPHRSSGGQRRYMRSDIRRVSFIRIAQTLGLTLPEIRAELDALPGGRTPNAQDWSAISTRLKQRLEARISLLSALRDRLDGCIGCGCLSLESCALYNPQDRAGRKGPGPRYLLGDNPESARPDPA